MAAAAWIGGTIASGFIGVVLAVLLQETVATALVRILGGVGLGAWLHGRDVSGDWFTYYAVIPDGATSSSAASPSSDIEVIQLRRVGRRVAGKNARRSRRYSISAVLRDDKFLTGTWQDFSDGRYHWGGFQLCWIDNGRGMVGKFVGKDSENHVNHGIWLWSRQRDYLLELTEWSAKKGGYRFNTDAIGAGLSDALQRSASLSLNSP